ncbi:GNAT family N-acetyltransferase [Asticcacaulis sp. AC402]|uniref:GNAT family N-acetyltransferase n=1 Tax=Asticcacaulis sp. AC402 TaxID=1282361 RepID=UPI0003C3B941|nr:GNAT family N-acetyltransferase [Asticcacaulis sp. AC402]ESQ75494.1 hypothetical protein ABAC402_08190 [Asticcacaulis sp. AC402]
MSDFAVIDFTTAAGLSFAQPAFAPSLDNAPLSRPDLSFAARVDGVVRACFSLWWRATPQIGGQPSVCLGHLYAEDAAWGLKALDHAGQVLRERGASGRVLAPMDGSTWFSYRVTIESGDTPPFFLERFSAPFWPQVFEACGFELTARYRSSLTNDLRHDDRAAAVWAEKIAYSGIRVRAFDPAHAEADMKALHSLSLTSFARNLFYTPISQADFLAAYAPILPLVVPDLVLLAHEGDELVGFVFAVPDYAWKQRGEIMDTVVVKTLAVRPGRSLAGLGSYLASQVHARAAALGYRRAIHAYMFEGNVSRVISDKSATSIRSYGLYAKA